MNETVNSETNENKAKKRIPLKPVIAAAVITALLVIACVFKDTFLSADALKKIRRNDFMAAKSISSYIGETKGSSLRKYIDLRLEINREYPRLLAEYDTEKIRSWRDAAQEIKDLSETANPKLFVEVSKLFDTLNSACSLSQEYEEMRPGILDMMDVFGEINRLYSRDGKGNGTPFTINEEYIKVEKWERQCSSLAGFSARVPGGESIYLLSFLITETRSECDDIKKQMEGLKEKGYGDDDTVRVSTGGHKTFPDIATSSGTSVSVSRKEEYEEYMYISVCRALAESLAEYYAGM